jgi:outer membrane protein assembly factor BamB
MRRIALSVVLLSALSMNIHAATDARKILDTTGTSGGLVVHLNCGDGELTAAMGEGESFLVHGLDTDPKRVEAARQRIRQAGLYGRVSVDLLRGERLPYANNLVNLLVLDSPQGPTIPAEELVRVLVPNGTAIIRKQGNKQLIDDISYPVTPVADDFVMFTKPWPKTLDTWPQSSHGPDGNMVSKDRVVGPPRRLQWIAEPKSARHHNMTDINVILSANGRVFYDHDEASTQQNTFPESMRLGGANHFPSQWALYGRDAFNGTLLWKRALKSWYEGVEYMRGNPPVYLLRRLVCDGDRLYLTPSTREPVEVLDAATGKTLKRFEQTRHAGELVLAEGRLFVTTWNPLEGSTQVRPKFETHLLVLDPHTGDILWKLTGPDTHQILPHSLAIRKDRVYFKTSEKLHCLSADKGTPIWSVNVGVPPNKTKQISSLPMSVYPWYVCVSHVPRVVALDDVVLCSARNRLRLANNQAPRNVLYAFDAKTGETLWTGPGGQGFFNPPDVLVVGHTVWSGYTPLDLKSGKIGPNAQVFSGGMVHHRCYPKKATERYLLASEAGVEFFDFSTRKQYPNHWVRGGCMTGILPANGLLYSTPHPCACFSAVLMNGMLALAPEGEDSGQQTEDSGDHHLIEGPAYPMNALQPSALGPQPSDWPIHRHDMHRSGTATMAISHKLTPAWQQTLGGRLSPVTVSDGKLFVAQIDQHIVHALDAESGRKLWSFTASGRVDTPPTLHGGLAVFGCRDGWTYCLRASDGELVWRALGGPRERLVGAYGQLESAWPIHGSLLVLNDAAVNEGQPVVYVAAGRNSFMDDGIYFSCLDLQTGRRLSHHRLAGPNDPEGNPMIRETFYMRGVRADFLVGDGRYIFMRDTALDLSCQEVPNQPGPRLISTGASLIDDTGFHRDRWMLDSTAAYSPRNEVNGVIMVFDKKHAYTVSGYSGKRTGEFDAAKGYDLKCFAYTPREQSADQKRALSFSQNAPPAIQETLVWRKKAPMAVKALVHVKTTATSEPNPLLFAAGPVTLGKSVQEVAQALTGKSKGTLWAISGSNGEKLAEYELNVPPVFDGMAAANGKLYLSLSDGTVICMQNQQPRGAK